jgi:sec-independent protein translocase protein TatB
MFGIGMPEMLLILAVALIVIGPKKLPDLARSLGKAMGEFKKATSELKESIQIDSELKDVKTTFNEIDRDLKKTAPVGEDAHPVEKTADGSPSATDPVDTVKAAFAPEDADVDGLPDDPAPPEVEPEDEIHDDFTPPERNPR